MWALFLILGPMAFASSPVDLCASYDDYGGAPCRIFSSCPMDENSVFLFISRSYPCKRYVIDKPEYYDLDMESFRKAVLEKFFPQDSSTISIEASTTSPTPTSTSTTTTPLSTTTTDRKFRQKTVFKTEPHFKDDSSLENGKGTPFIQEELTTRRPTNIELQMFPELESRTLEEPSYDPKGTQNGQNESPIVVIVLAALIPSLLVFLVSF